MSKHSADIPCILTKDSTPDSSDGSPLRGTVTSTIRKVHSILQLISPLEWNYILPEFPPILELRQRFATLVDDLDTIADTGSGTWKKIEADYHLLAQQILSYESAVMPGNHAH